MILWLEFTNDLFIVYDVRLNSINK